MSDPISTRNRELYDRNYETDQQITSTQQEAPISEPGVSVLKIALQLAQDGQATTDEKVEAALAVLNHVDNNNDGKITEVEFLAHYANPLGQLRNGGACSGRESFEIATRESNDTVRDLPGNFRLWQNIGTIIQENFGITPDNPDYVAMDYFCDDREERPVARQSTETISDDAVADTTQEEKPTLQKEEVESNYERNPETPYVDFSNAEELPEGTSEKIDSETTRAIKVRVIDPDYGHPYLELGDFIPKKI